MSNWQVTMIFTLRDRSSPRTMEDDTKQLIVSALQKLEAKPYRFHSSMTGNRSVAADFVVDVSTSFEATAFGHRLREILLKQLSRHVDIAVGQPVTGRAIDCGESR